ncbi:DUF397 domain-containing protein [Spirillospora sp. NPDC047279]|uniref:DUF397 domain-containing protein n=1 Tax=Spirillospora sp. NPDC047279 TaxID=3155478 RepID=UPI0034068F07
MTQWRKSTRSDTDDPISCVEVANFGSTIAVRDSQDPHGPQLHLDGRAWRGLLSNIKASRRQG